MNLGSRSISEPGGYVNAQEHFGRYTLVEKIAVGGMGELYLAQQAGASGDLEKVVVKRIRPELVHDPQFVEMFLNEGRLASMFRHPNIVEIYELGRVDDTYFMAMEYVPGQNLGDILDRLGGPLDVGLALHIIVEVCAGLSAAHEARDDEGRAMRLVHRDISPPNVLISFDGGVKLTDFGIAKVARQQQQTRAGVLKGKFAYLSPEQSLGEPIDRRSDIYALGLVLFEATVGCRANPGAAEVEQIYASSQGRVLKPSLEDPRYPPDLERIFFKATALAPRDRYENAREMQRDLEDFMELRGTSVSRADVGAFLCETFPEKARAAGVVLHEPEAPPSVNFPTSPTDMRFETGFDTVPRGASLLSGPGVGFDDDEATMIDQLAVGDEEMLNVPPGEVGGMSRRAPPKSSSELDSTLADLPDFSDFDEDMETQVSFGRADLGGQPIVALGTSDVLAGDNMFAATREVETIQPDQEEDGDVGVVFAVEDVAVRPKDPPSGDLDSGPPEHVHAPRAPAPQGGGEIPEPSWQQRSPRGPLSASSIALPSQGIVGSVARPSPTESRKRSRGVFWVVLGFLIVLAAAATAAYLVFVWEGDTQTLGPALFDKPKGVKVSPLRGS